MVSKKNHSKSLASQIKSNSPQCLNKHCLIQTHLT